MINIKSIPPYLSHSKAKGFTLVEMLIVIAILAILYAMAAANVLGLQYEAKIARVKGDLKTLELALNSYFKNHKVCPVKDGYQTALLQAKYNILNGYLYDPFGSTVNTQYSYDTSGNDFYYVAYSVGLGRNGSATVSNNGKVGIENEPILVTNGDSGLTK